MHFDHPPTREQINQQLLSMYSNIYYNHLNNLHDIKRSMDQLMIYNNTGIHQQQQQQQQQQQNPLPTTTHNTRRRTTRREDTPRELSQLVNSFLESIPIVPSQQQINQAIRELNFSDIENPINTQCPISLVDFQPEQRVSQIIHCGHIIETQNLNQWFHLHSSCPICRVDIRSQPVNQTQTQTQTTTTIELGVTGVEDLLRAFANL